MPDARDGGIAEMAGMSRRIRQRTDALDAAGNTTAAIGKVRAYIFNASASHEYYRIHSISLQGFAIGSAALVSLALFLILA